MKTSFLAATGLGLALVLGAPALAQTTTTTPQAGGQTHTGTQGTSPAAGAPVTTGADRPGLGHGQTQDARGVQGGSPMPPGAPGTTPLLEPPGGAQGSVGGAGSGSGGSSN